MKRKNIRDTPAELFVPDGYEFEDIYDTADNDMDMGKPVIEEEVTVHFGRKGEK